MKKILLLCLLLPSLCLHADMVITESVELGGRTVNTTMKIKGDKIRVDGNPLMSTILDTSTGDSIQIIHQQKSYVKISGSQMKAMTEQMKKIQAQAPSAAKPSPVDTGKSEKVGNFNAEIYTMDAGTAQYTLWVTKDIPNYAVLKEQLNKFRTMSKGGAAAAAPEFSELDGVSVKTQIVARGKTITITILSAVETPVDDAEMAPPAGYTEISMPNFGGGGARPPQP